MSYEDELRAEADATGAPYAELLCLTRSLGLSTSLRVDAAARAYVVDGPDGAVTFPFGWLPVAECGEGGGA